jgi:hypothetical protein
MKGGYVLNWLIKVAQCLKNGFPIYQDTVGGIRSTGTGERVGEALAAVKEMIRRL